MMTEEQAIVVIIGGFGGLGLALSQTFFEAGWNVVGTSRRMSAVRSIGERYTRSVVIGSPLSSKFWTDVEERLGAFLLRQDDDLHDSPSTMIDHYESLVKCRSPCLNGDSCHLINKFKALNSENVQIVFICTCGDLQEVSCLEMTPDSVHFSIDAHVNTALNTLQFAQSHFSSSHVVFIGSDPLDFDGCFGAGPYIVAKHALRGLFEAAQEDLFGCSTRLSLISPQTLDTPLFADGDVPTDAVDPRVVAKEIFALVS